MSLIGTRAKPCQMLLQCSQLHNMLAFGCALVRLSRLCIMLASRIIAASSPGASLEHPWSILMHALKDISSALNITYCGEKWGGVQLACSCFQLVSCPGPMFISLKYFSRVPDSVEEFSHLASDDEQVTLLPMQYQQLLFFTLHRVKLTGLECHVLFSTTGACPGD